MKTILTALSVKNYKTLENINLKFGEHSFILKGQNGAGKSSLMQSLLTAMGVEKADAEMVMHGKDKSSIELKFSRDGEDYVATVKLDAKKGTDKVEVTHADGRTVKGGPITFLKAAFGPHVEIDKVLERQTYAEGRRENERMFLTLANLDVDKLEKMTNEIKDKEKIRTATGQNRDNAEGYVNKTRDQVNPEKYKAEKELKPLYDEHHAEINAAKWVESEKVAEVDAEYKVKMKPLIDDSDLKEVHLSLQAEKNDLDRWKNNLALGNDKMTESINTATLIQEKIQELQAELTDVIQKRTKISEGIKQCEEKVQELSPVVEKIKAVEADLIKVSEENDLIKAANSVINQKIVMAIEGVRTAVRNHNSDIEFKAKENLDAKVKELNEWNKQVQAAREFVNQLNSFEQLKELWTEQQEEIMRLRSLRTNYIMTGVFPIPELKYDEEELGITYKGLPLSQKLMSAGEMVLLGIAINAAYNPNGGNVMCIPNAMMLDKKNRHSVMELLKENGYFGLFEEVAESETLQIEVITEGLD